MGLRTASVRRSHVAAAMAPALTDSTKSQNFNLPPKSHLEPASPINSYETKNKYQPTTVKEPYNNSDRLSPLNCDDLNIACGNIHCEDSIQSKDSDDLVSQHSGASDNIIPTYNTMSVSPSPMGDQDITMGIQKPELNLDNIHVKPTIKSDGGSDVDHLSGGSFCVSSDQNDVADLFMEQILNSMDDGERLNNTTSDLSESLSFAKELLDVDMMNISIDDQEDEHETQQKIKENQARDLLADLQKRHNRVERRLDFLRRRTYKLQARFMGQHVSGEIAGVFEQVHRALKRPHDVPKPFLNSTTTSEDPDKPKPMVYSSTKTLVRKLETSAHLQANTAARQKNIPKYFGAGSVEVPTIRTSVAGMVMLPPWSSENKQELQKVTGQLQSQLGLVQEEFDSEATESSSGGESCDEMQIYSNPHQQYLSIQKRALWKYSTDRAAVAARWTWLQSQISDLEYRIRQHMDIHKQIRAAKGPIQLGGSNPQLGGTNSQLGGTNSQLGGANLQLGGIEVPSVTSPTAVNGFRGQLPGNAKSTDLDGEFQCARTRPLLNFRKRKLLQVAGLHAVSKKAARPSSVRCGCVPPRVPCALCTGRTDPTHPRDSPDTLSKQERVALLDASFHPVFSLPEDTSQSVHFEAIMKTFEWQQRSTRMKTMRVLCKPDRDRLESKSIEHRTKKLEHRRKYGRLKASTVSALSEKLKSKIRGRKPGRHSLNRLKKRHTAKMALAQMNVLSAEGADEEVEAAVGGASSSVTGGASSLLGGDSLLDSPRSSPLLQMQSISGFGSRNRSSRIDSYDIDNIVIPYSVAASTRVEKLQYKEILTPKWRIADTDYVTVKSEGGKNNGVVREQTGDDSDVEDVSEEAVVARHDRCEHDEKKKFLSYMKMPIGYGRQRSHKRTDSLAESSGGNTPDPMSPHAPDTNDQTPITSPPATPLPPLVTSVAPLAPPTLTSTSATPLGPPSVTSTAAIDEGPLPSIALMRRRTISQSRFKEVKEESVAVEVVEVPPYDGRTFPLAESTYEAMLKVMPENHQQLKTNTRSQDHHHLDQASDEAGGCSPNHASSSGFYDDVKMATNSPLDSETTESAVGEDLEEEEEEDPNDPEWLEEERAARERHKR